MFVVSGANVINNLPIRIMVCVTYKNIKSVSVPFCEIGRSLLYKLHHDAKGKFNHRRRSIKIQTGHR